MSIWNGAASAGIGAATGILSMIGQRERENRAMENQKELMGIQLGHQQRLNKQGADLQYEMWKKTNFPAQIKMLDEAGLSRGLFYGMSGAGGTTVGNQGGGNASGGNAPAPQPMEIQNMLQAAATKSQIELQKAQAEKIKEEAKDKKLDNVTKERFGQEADMIEAQNRKSKALQEGYYLYETLQGGEREHAIDSNFVRYMNNEHALKEVERRIAQVTEQDEKAQMRYRTASAALDAKLKQANINLTNEQSRKVWHDIWQGWTNAGFKGLSEIVNTAILKNAGKFLKGRR